jgi:hypothetical protein
MIVVQYLLIQLPLQHLHLVLILLAHSHYFISNCDPDRLHLVQILTLILTVKQIRVSLNNDLLKEVLPKMFLHQIPYLLRVTLKQRHCLKDLVDGHV